MAKKIKVQLTNQKSVFYLGSQAYYPGDIFEIDEYMFRSDFMVKVVEPKKPKKPKEEPVATEETSLVEEVTSEVIAARTAPKVRKRKKT